MLSTGRAALVLFLVITASAPARPVPLNVRAGAVVELDHRRTRDGLELAGRLLDDQGAPITDERLSIELGDREAESLTTDQDGRFSLKLDRRTTAALERIHRTDIPWSVRFPGSRRFSDVVARGAIDLARRASRLTLTASASRATANVPLKDDAATNDRKKTIRLLPSDQSMSLIAHLEEPLDGTPLGDAEIRLRVGDGAELVGRTGMNGQVAFILTPDQLAAGADYRVTARFSGDALHVPALAELDVRMLLPTRLTLRVVREGDARRGRYRFSGRLSDQNGPVAGAVIAVLGREADLDADAPNDDVVVRRLVATGPDGIFVTSIDARELDEKKLRRLLVQAAFQPVDARAPTLSRPVLLEVPPPAGIPVAWYLLAMTALVLAAALAHAHRTGAFSRAWKWLGAALARPEPLRPTHPHTPPLATSTPHQTTRPQWLSGRIIDGHEGTPLRATLRVRDASGPHEVTTDPHGLFELGPLAPGPCFIEVGAPGYLTRELAFDVPHTGTYDGATWSLVAVKRKLRDILGETVGGLGQDLAWGTDTPREALAKTLARHADRATIERPLAELTMLVERAHFARRPVEPPAVEHARDLQRQIGGDA